MKPIKGRTLKNNGVILTKSHIRQHQCRPTGNAGKESTHHSCPHLSHRSQAFKIPCPLAKGHRQGVNSRGHKFPCQEHFSPSPRQKNVYSSWMMGIKACEVWRQARTRILGNLDRVLILSTTWFFNDVHLFIKVMMFTIIINLITWK